MEAPERRRGLRRIVGLISTVCSAFLLEPSHGESCPVILREARISCQDRPLPQTLSACQSAGCCWDETSIDPDTKCYAKECKPGYFGWQCKFQCHCDGGADATCNRYTGECQYGCSPERWGVGCLLESNCTYNDPTGIFYTGKRSKTDSNRQCVNWSLQRAYPAVQFPDKDIAEAGNYCRNPKPPERKAWCYWKLAGGSQRRWGYCTLQDCTCPVGRFGINCVSECHCENGDYCDQETGFCGNGRCDVHWTGNNCQDCSDGHFGLACESECHCYSSTEVCDKGTGQCESGCAPGWQGQDCQTECPDGRYGLNCDFDCNCRTDREVCNKTSGKCKSGCKLGYAGDNCLILLPVMTRFPDTETRNASSITIRWREWSNPPDKGSGPVSDYVIYFKPHGDFNWTVVNKSTMRSAAVGNLQMMKNYQFKVAAVHSAGFVGTPSPTLTVVTCGRPLSGPVSVRLRPSISTINSESSDDDGLRGGGVNGDHTDSSEAKQRISIVVEWRLPSRDKYNCINIRQYRVYTKKAADDNFIFLQAVDVHRVTVNDIDPYANLSIGVSVVNNAGLESDLVETFYVGKSGPVKNFDVKPSTATTLQLRWAPNENPNSQMRYYIVTYRVLQISSCAPSAEAWSPWMDIEPDRTELELPDLLPYTRYQVKIWPHTEAGKGQEIVMSATTEPSDPPEISQFERVRLSASAAKFSWNEVDCRKSNGVMRGYAYRLVMRRNGIETTVVENLVNRTELEFHNLVPYTNYSIEMWLVNHQFNGPRSQAEFMTFEDVPPAPRNIAIIQRQSESISVQWEAPNPPHGVIMGYYIKYSLQQVQKDALISSTGSEVVQYNVTHLEPHNLYSIQVRAFTKIGNSTWSELVMGFTDESVPSEPRNLKNVSRSGHTVRLQWDVPRKPNGVIIQYKITCSPVSTSGKFLRDVEEICLPETLDCLIDGLKPGINYVCSAVAETKKGLGLSTNCVFWTEPEISVTLSPPEIEFSKITDTSVSISLPSVPSIEYMDEADRLYRIVVEKRGLTRRRKKRSNEESTNSGIPCHLKNSEILDFVRSRNLNVPCYVAAEFFSVSDGQTFVVGDNKTYGGYYNGPLEKDTNYYIWFGIVVTVDGVTASSYSRAETNHIIPVSSSPSNAEVESNNENAAMAGAVVGALAAIGVIVAIVVIVIYKILRREKKGGKIPADSGSGMDIEKTEARQLLKDDPSSAKDMEKQHKPIRVDNLWNYVVAKKMSLENGFRQEYEELDQSFIFKHEVAKKPENRLKNRYGNIVAYDHSRVVLDCLPDDPHSDYINGNYIDSYKKPKAFIAAQGPNKWTLNDIWRMTWQLFSTKIVMVANLMEDGRHKCEQYWPEQDNPKKPEQENPKCYGDIQVTMVELEQFADFKIRTFILNRGSESRTVRQFHFTAWPDHGVPMYPTSLLAFRKKVRSYDDPSAGPTIVHCSAGVGRSGTFIALDNLLDEAKAEGKVDIFNCVKQMRNNRVNMVQTLEQYIFVYDALLEALKSGDTSIACVEFQRKYSNLQAVNAQTGQSFLKDEFDLLGTMVLPAPTDMSKLDAWSAENINKNRFRDIVPVSRLSRPYLRSYINASSDYINAVYTDGYKQRDAFIITQTPLPSTMVDFWAMIADHSCHTIVMMDDFDPSDSTIGHYYPLETGSLTFGPFTVDMVTADESNPSFTVRDFTITYSKRVDSNGPVFVRHFQYKGWAKQETLPTKSSMISLLVAIEKWQQRSGNTVIVVHCIDGAIRSGLLCAVSYMVERLKVEQDIDVFQSVKHARINRSQLIPHYEQYQFLYDMATEYMACFDTYSNFK